MLHQSFQVFFSVASPISSLASVELQPVCDVFLVSSPTQTSVTLSASQLVSGVSSVSLESPIVGILSEAQAVTAAAVTAVPQLAEVTFDSVDPLPDLSYDDHIYCSESNACNSVNLQNFEVEKATAEQVFRCKLPNSQYFEQSVPKVGSFVIPADVISTLVMQGKKRLKA